MVLLMILDAVIKKGIDSKEEIIKLLEIAVRYSALEIGTNE